MDREASVVATALDREPALVPDAVERRLSEAFTRNSAGETVANDSLVESVDRGMSADSGAAEPAVEPGWRLLHEDRWLLVLDKASGLLTEPGRGLHLRDSLLVRVRQQWPEARLVHRLDRDTSGALVLARDPETHRALNRQFELRQVEKRYLAVVAGHPPECGSIDAPLMKDFDRPPRHKVDYAGGRKAETQWVVIERGADRSRVELSPHTGRSHQLRVHMQALGHPILGDPLYADEATFYMAPRLLLHAWQLSLTHPGLNRNCVWTADCPF